MSSARIQAFAFNEAPDPNHCDCSLRPALCSAVLRSASSVALGGPEQASPDPFRRGKAGFARSRFNGYPAFVIHAEVALRGLPSGGPSASAFDLDLLFHARNIWAPTFLSILDFVGRQINRESVECTQQLGVMTQQKKPAACSSKQRGEQQSGD
jgi:hypothetical protein